jgi:hypothetical protein
MGLIIVFFLCSTFVFHGTIIGAEVYSNPSVIIASKNQVIYLINITIIVFNKIF